MRGTASAIKEILYIKDKFFSFLVAEEQGAGFI